MICQSDVKLRSIKIITVLQKVVDILDICNFFRCWILPICWRYQRLVTLISAAGVTVSCKSLLGGPLPPTQSHHPTWFSEIGPLHFGHCLASIHDNTAPRSHLGHAPCVPVSTIEESIGTLTSSRHSIHTLGSTAARSHPCPYWRCDV